MQDKVSLIIPVYNRQEYIDECIRSIQAQSYQDFEIVIIDDGSSDETLSICKSLAQKEPRIKLLEAQHGGVSAARNLGLDVAEGEFVFFLDSDDVIHPQLLETLVKGLRTTDAQIAGTDVLTVPQEKWTNALVKLRQTAESWETTYQDHRRSLEAALCERSPLSMIGGVMICRGLIGQTRFRTDLTIGEDFFFIYENLIKGASSVFSKQKLYFARIHKGNSSWDYSYTGFWTRFLRRKLVADSEAAAGRMDFAKRQRQGAFASYPICLQKNKPYNEDARKMRKTIYAHRKELFPALGWKDRLIYCLSMYMPFVYCVAMALWRKLKKRK